MTEKELDDGLLSACIHLSKAARLFAKLGYEGLASLLVDHLTDMLVILAKNLGFGT